MLPWYNQNPDYISLAEANEILQDPTARRLFPNQYKALLSSVANQINEIAEQSRAKTPIGWVQPSYEQHLKLECWLYGIDYIIDFDANRIGKTAGGVFNAILWLIPNDPDWVMFRSYTDHLNRTYHCTPRPPVSAIREIRKHLQSLQLTADPTLPKDHPTNLPAYQATLRFLSNPLTPTFKANPPKRTVWCGGPTTEWNAKNIVQEWKKWMPSAYLHSYSEYKHTMELEIDKPEDKVYPIHKITVLFKSYDAEDTTWSGGAVDGIIMSEGIPQNIFNEIKQRFKYPAFGSWDYTPYEPRNTGGKSALAHRVYKGEEEVPLTPFIFSGFGIEATPTYIMDEEKRNDLLKMWKGKPEGEARIKGLFYSNSPLVIKNYNPEIHALNMTLEELEAKWAPKPLIFFRGLDPGWSHVSACAFMALAPDNSRYIYKFYSRSQRTIEERCSDIIEMSGNTRVPHPKNPSLFVERTTPKTKIQMTWLDYHSFKTDENTGRSFSLNYLQNGLIVSPSVTYGPNERAGILDNLLKIQPHLPHPERKKPPGSMLYFLINGEGVAEAINKITNIFWLTFSVGEKRGLTKDTIQDYDDDELDALCYVACPVLTYTSFIKDHDDDLSAARRTSSISFANGIVDASKYSSGNWS